jgi:hypothetical protein
MYASMFEYCVLGKQPTQSSFISSCFGGDFSKLEKFPGELNVFILNNLSQENKSQLCQLVLINYPCVLVILPVWKISR